MTVRRIVPAPDPFASGLFPVCASTHDLGVQRLFDLATLLLLLDCRPGDLVLDVGAGPGFSSEMMARLGYHVVAVDPDRRALAHNRRRPSFDRTRILGTVRVVQSVADPLPLAEGAFDGVLAMNVLHHVPDLSTVTSELARVLKPGCRAVFCEPGLDHLEHPDTQRAIAEHGEDDRAFDVLAFLRQARTRGFSAAMLTATLQPQLRLLPIEELDAYLSGRHPRPQLTAAGVVHELHRRHACGVVVREGTRPKTSRHPGTLRCRLEVAGVPKESRREHPLQIDVRVQNTGDTLWLTEPDALGGFVSIGCKIMTPEGRLVTDAWGRTPLERDVAPGEWATATMTLDLHDKVAPGDYVLHIDMVDELICWFSDLSPDSGVKTPIAIR